MGLIREKLPVNQGASIAMNVLVMNLQKLLELLFFFFAYWLQLMIGDGVAKRRQAVLLGVQTAAA